MTIIDLANFRKCVYELIENEDSVMEREDIGTVEGLAEAFLTGKVAILYDPKSQCLRWVHTDVLKKKGLKT